MLDIDGIKRLSEIYTIPFEDVLFIALNTNGVDLECDYNRMRMSFHVEDSDLFAYAKERGVLDYYFALPITRQSPFVMRGDIISLQNVVIGQAIGATEDICNDNYSRRGGTVLNLNPNSRTSCSGCQFCYTAYQVPNDRKRLKEESDLRDFFEEWMLGQDLSNLSHLIQVAVVTGCYNDGDELGQFLLKLKRVLTDYQFHGQIFYLGSQITTKKQLTLLTDMGSFCLCYSLETFKRRDLLRDKKRVVTLQDICDSMDFALSLGHEVNFSYIVGTEPLDTMEKYFTSMKQHINRMPIINTLQMHKYHDPRLVDPCASRLSYYMEARKILERVFSSTNMRPQVWEDYRSLWFLTFGNEPLLGVRTP